MTKVFVYGSLKKGGGNHGVLGRSKLIGEGLTNSRGFNMFDGSFPFVTDDLIDTERAGSIMGEVYEVENDAVMNNLDRLEGVPHLYVRREVKVTTLDAVEHDAIMYVTSEASHRRLAGRTPMSPAGRSAILEWHPVISRRVV